MKEDQPVPIEIQALASAVTEADFQALVHLLRECVQAGASIGFLHSSPREEAETYWKKVIADLSGGYRTILVARDETGKPVGSVQISFEARANGRHRAEVQKLMVLPAFRRCGIAVALMRAAEKAAQSRNVSLLFLDTSDGSGGARAFYDSIGYTYVGGIPGYALDPDGQPAKNAIYYRQLT